MNPLIREVEEALARLTAAGARRRIDAPCGVDFASNDTLGLRFDPRVIDAARVALSEYGAGAGAARLLRGDTPVHRELEEELRVLSGHEDALLFSSGFHANLGVLQTLGGAGWTILSDAHNHASIVEGCRAAKARVVVFPHNEVPAAPDTRTLVVTESVFSMGGDRVRLAPIDVPLIVDEAHAVGIFAPIRDAMISVFPCGKALAGAGAVVTGPRPVIELLRSCCRTFLFTTAPPPPVVGAALAALRIAHAEPWRGERALELARRVDARAESPIVMVACRDNAHALERQASITARGLDVRAVRPPTVPRAALRISVHADRTDDEVARLCAALEETA